MQDLRDQIGWMVTVRLKADQAFIIGELDNLLIGVNVVFKENFKLMPQHKALSLDCKLLDIVNAGVELEL